MEISWIRLIIAGLGMTFALEGLLYFIAPAKVKKMFALLPLSSDYTLRMLGLIAVILGLLVLVGVKHY